MVKLGCGLVIGVLAAILGTGPAWAQQPGAEPGAAVARLEAQLQEQQQQIQRLEQQLAAADQAQSDAARIEAMRVQIREILSEQEFRESLMPSLVQAGYDNGFFIRSSDDKFSLKINGGTQFRWTYYEQNHRNRYLLPRLERDDRTGFDLQRIRLAFSGNVYSKDLTYYMELRADAPDGYRVVANEIWTNYRIADAFQIRTGLMVLPSTRQQSIYTLNQQMIDRSVTDAVYSLGYGIGVKFWGQLCNKRLEYHLAVANSITNDERAGLGRVITTDPPELDTNPAILFRAVWHALGENPETDFLTESDRPKHQSPALDFGFHYAFNEDNGDRITTNIPFPRRTILAGGYGLTTTNGLQINQFGLDTGFKWCGFSATGEYIVRIVDPTHAGRTPFTPWWLLTADGSTVAQHGAYVQVGYFLPIPCLQDKLEIVGRVGGVSTLAEEQEGTWEYAGGVNYYLSKNNNVKIQADITKVYEVPITSSYSSLANVNDDALIFRVQFQVAF